MSSKFGFILVKPQLGENIGACARAMKNFGFSKLHIVEPKINFPNHKAKATSVGAFDIINKAKVFNNIKDAIEPFNLVISLSARRRDINKKNISLKEFQKRGFKLCTLTSHNATPISDFSPSEPTVFILGNETHGVSQSIMDMSDYRISIPMANGVESLNVAVTAALVAFNL